MLFRRMNTQGDGAILNLLRFLLHKKKTSFLSSYQLFSTMVNIYTFSLEWERNLPTNIFWFFWRYVRSLFRSLRSDNKCHKVSVPWFSTFGISRRSSWRFYLTWILYHFYNTNFVSSFRMLQNLSLYCLYK